MLFRHILDWDAAYANGVNIARGDAWPDAWARPAKAFRERMVGASRADIDVVYGPAARNRFDLFHPADKPKGTVIFVHGGYWKQMDKALFSHLASGAIERGFLVAMPTYTLCPDIRISGIVSEIGAAVSQIAAQSSGPLFLTGHSAGGHLVSRMICADSPLARSTRDRIAHVLSISGVHDLRPIMHTSMNATLGIDEFEATTHSPVLLRPMTNTSLTCWVGAGERSEFIRQNALLANIWSGLGARTTAVEEPDHHHFDVVDGLADPDHPLLKSLLMI